jgi:hypothetical protein
VILKPLPFRDPARLLAVWDTYLPQFSKVGISPAELQAWQSQPDLFEDTAWYRYVPLDGNLALPGSEPVVVHADLISANLFSLLGTSPVLGRGFASTEDPHSVLLSEHLWRSRFGGDTQVIGKIVHFNDDPFTVVGVMPPVAQFSRLGRPLAAERATACGPIDEPRATCTWLCGTNAEGSQ